MKEKLSKSRIRYLKSIRRMKELPEYIDCKRKEIEHCDYYMTKLCPESCGYAIDIKPMGIGAVVDGGLLKRLKQEVSP